MPLASAYFRNHGFQHPISPALLARNLAIDFAEFRYSLLHEFYIGHLE